MSVFTPDEELLVHICNCLHHLSAEVLYVDSFVLVLVDLQLITLLRKQIDDFLVVEFEHGDLHQKLSSRGAVDGLDDMFKGSWDNTLMVLILF